MDANQQAALENQLRLKLRAQAAQGVLGAQQYDEEEYEEEYENEDFGGHESLLDYETSSSVIPFSQCSTSATFTSTEEDEDVENEFTSTEEDVGVEYEDDDQDEDGNDGGELGDETRADSSRGDPADDGPSDPSNAEPADPPLLLFVRFSGVSPPAAEGEEQDEEGGDDPEWTRGTLEEGAGEEQEEPLSGRSEGGESQFELTYDLVERVGEPPAINATCKRPLLGLRRSFIGLEGDVDEVLAADGRADIAEAEREGAALVANLFAGKRVVDAAADHTASDHTAADHTEERQETLGAAIDRLLVTHDVAGKMKEL